MRLVSSALIQLLAASILAGLPFARAVPTLDPPPTLAFSPATGIGPTQDVIQPADVELFPLLLVSTLSGGLHALDRETGEEVWGIPPALPAASAEPSASGAQAGLNAGTDDELLAEKFLVDPREGMVYLATKDANQWQLNKLGVTVPDLVQASFQSSPVRFASDPNPSRLFIGSQSTALLALDMRTGEIVNAVDTAGSETTADRAADSGVRNSTLDDILDHLEGPDRSATERQILWLTRTDYTLRVHTPSIPPSPPQTLVYTTFSPRSSLTNHPASIFSLPHSLDSQYHQLAVTPVKTGLACLKETSSGTLVMLWGLEFESDFPVGLWDVFVLRETGGLFVGRQVNPRRSLIVDQHGQLVKSNAGVLVTRGGGPNGDELLALSTDSYPFLGIVGALPPPSVGKLEGWHPGLQPSSLNETERSLSREVWDAQLGEGMARMVERLMIEVGNTDDEGGNRLDDANNMAADRPQRRWLGKWLAFVLLGGVLPLLSLIGFHLRRAGVETALMPASLVVQAKANSATQPSKVSTVAQTDLTVLLGTTPSEKALPAVPITNDSIVSAEVGSISAVGDAEPEGKKKKRRQRRKGKKDDDPDAESTKDPSPPETDSRPIPAFVSAQATPILPPSRPTAALEAIIAVPPPSSSPSPPPPTTREALTISDDLLGTGSHGTLVFRGTFQSRPVAVKRLLSHFTLLHEREISLLQSSDHHPNIVRYFYQEHREPWLLIALELCPCSLGELVERGPGGDAAIWAEWKGREEEALLGAVQGVEHLHSLKICHRDIKPQNILVTLTKSGNIRLLISDFGLAKQQTLDQSSFGATLYSASATGHLPTGSPGWRAPELLLESTGENAEDCSGWEIVGENSSGSGSGKLSGRPARLSRKVDVFALGCVLAWALSGGIHPFGNRMERERNIIKNRPTCRSLERDRQQEALNLVSRMIAFDSRARPSLPFVTQHPCFWPSSRQLAFLQDASDRFEILVREPPHPWLVALEKSARRVIPPGGWMAAMSPGFVESLGKYRKYDVGSVRDLLRALRNKRHHYLDMPAELREEMSPLPDGFLGYFQTRFPQLLMQVYEAIEGNADMVNDDAFRPYFPAGRYVP